MSPTLASYRDDGPVAMALRRLAPARLPAAWTALAAAATLAAALLADGDRTASASLVGVGVFVVLGAATGGGAQGRLRWVVPPVLHAGEYAAVIALAWRAGTPATAFALLAVTAYHHYDLVYVRGAGRVPRPVDLLAGGWDGRMLMLVVASAAGVFTGVAIALAVWSGLLSGVAGGTHARMLARAGTGAPTP